MKLLLDTHALIWALGKSHRLPVTIAGLLEDPDNTVLVSAACAYEIEFKRVRDPEIAALPIDVQSVVQSLGFEWLSIDSSHASMAGGLARLHGDPFDRIIVAQGLVESATIVTRDPAIAAYGAPTIW